MSFKQARRFASQVSLVVTNITCICGSLKLIAHNFATHEDSREFCPCCDKIKTK